MTFFSSTAKLPDNTRDFQGSRDSLKKTLGLPRILQEYVSQIGTQERQVVQHMAKLPWAPSVPLKPVGPAPNPCHMHLGQIGNVTPLASVY